MENKKVLNTIFASNILFALHTSVILYVNSNFLNQFIGEQMIGVLYAFAAFLTIIALLIIPTLLQKVGNYTTIIVTTLIEAIAVGLLVFAINLPIIIIFFILYRIAHILILFGMDVFLEKNSTEESTGEIRGKFLTTTNVALLVSPLIVGLLLTNGDYWKVYLLSVLFLIPFLAVISRLKNFKDPKYDKMKIVAGIQYVLKNKNIASILVAQALLRIFFAWMIIYTPLYLHAYIGLSWADIGIVFTIMLIPYVLLELPLGKIADDVLGEKEFLITGFIILAGSTAIIPFITTNSIIVWSVLLFVTRIGATFIEIMTETYFFKCIDGTNTEAISLFRIMRPVGEIIGPVMAAILLFVMPLQWTFLLLAILLLVGIPFSLRIKDTR